VNTHDWLMPLGLFHKMGIPWLSDAWFLGAAVLLDYFDVSLPRGDSIGVSGALCSAAVVVLGPVHAAIIALVSAVAAHVLRRGPVAGRRLMTVLASRAAALVAATAFLVILAGRAVPTVTFVFVAAAFLLTELVAAQSLTAFWTGRPLVRLLRGNISSQAPLIAAEWSASVLLLLTYDGMRDWSLVPSVVLLLLIRQSYALFLDIRETYRTTVEVLVEAAESQDERRAGHGDRTAILARSIAMKAGLSSSEVERISFAALLHDLGELAERPMNEVPVGARHATSADIVADVEFFSNVEPVLRLCEEDAGGRPGDDTLLAALIVALASDIDAQQYPDVGNAHRGSLLARVSGRVPAALKARAVGAALRLGYRIPAVD
jgi:hypothetical protein